MNTRNFVLACIVLLQVCTSTVKGGKTCYSYSQKIFATLYSVFTVIIAGSFRVGMAVELEGREDFEISSGSFNLSLSDSILRAIIATSHLFLLCFISCDKKI